MQTVREMVQRLAHLDAVCDAAVRQVVFVTSSPTACETFRKATLSIAFKSSLSMQRGGFKDHSAIGW